jgi:mRNA-degrading endonuclease toxin of MazEF toxin-antitoxin module
MGVKLQGTICSEKGFSRGALILTNMDGEDLPRLVNSDVITKYYA